MESYPSRMKAVILAAGFGTRLQRDIENDTSGNYSHLKGVPKPLLPIGNKPLLTHWVDMLKGITLIDQVFVMVSTNSLAFIIFP